MDVWRLELITDDEGDHAVADRVLRSIGVDVGWSSRPAEDHAAGGRAVVAGVDLGFRVDPPAVVRSLSDAGVQVRELRRLPSADGARADADRRIA